MTPRSARLAWIALVVAALAAASCSDSPTGVECPDGDCGGPTTGCDDTLAVPTAWTYEVVAEYPHDHGAFTQGLVIRDGRLFEGTGRYGASNVREVDLDTGDVLRQHDNASNIFGEGITILDSTLYQITWRNYTAFRYDPETFETRGAPFTYEGQGWGITDDGEVLIMSNGSPTIVFRDPDTFEVLREIRVFENLPDGRRRVVNELNELEWIDGEIYANVWRTNRVARICPDTGMVVGWIDFTGLSAHDCPGKDVLNGIAYDADAERLFVTGKWWCVLFEVELRPDTTGTAASPAP